MIKRIKAFSIFSILLILLILNVACQNNINLSLNKTSLTLYQGENYELEINGSTNIAIWSSNNEDVAIIENGKVKALSVGDAIITAKIENKNLECNVKVIKAFEPENKLIISLSKRNHTLNINDNYQISASVYYDNTKIDEKVEWQSDNESIIDINVDSNDSNNIIITAKEAGQAIITASYKDYKSYCNIKVRDNNTYLIEGIVNINDLHQNFNYKDIKIKFIPNDINSNIYEFNEDNIWNGNIFSLNLIPDIYRLDLDYYGKIISYNDLNVKPEKNIFNLNFDLISLGKKPYGDGINFQADKWLIDNEENNAYSIETYAESMVYFTGVRGINYVIETTISELLSGTENFPKAGLIVANRYAIMVDSNDLVYIINYWDEGLTGISITYYNGAIKNANNNRTLLPKGTVKYGKSGETKIKVIRNNMEIDVYIDDVLYVKYTVDALNNKLAAFGFRTQGAVVKYSNYSFSMNQ